MGHSTGCSAALTTHTRLAVHLQECAANADQAFLTAVSLPVLAAVAAAAYVARPPPAELRESGEVFEDEATGVMFQAEPDEAEPERDKDVSG
jgi:hypothetical protein